MVVLALSEFPGIGIDYDESKQLMFQALVEGATCFINYSNTEILSETGQWNIPYITMGDELIHALHALLGAMKWDKREEEWFTVGIKGFEGWYVTENDLRAEAGFDLRQKYFRDD